MGDEASFAGSRRVDLAPIGRIPTTTGTCVGAETEQFWCRKHLIFRQIFSFLNFL